MNVNVERLRSELEFVTRNQAHHNQALWFEKFPENACNTKGCLAGWTGIHHGMDQLEAFTNSEYIGGKEVPVITYEPVGKSWTQLGLELLGLNWYIADELFHADNTLWDLWNVANVITNGEIEIPEEVEANKPYDNRTDGNEEYIREYMED